MAKYFTIRKDEEEYLEFELANVNISLANAIRRIVLSEVETIAIDEKNIKITENTCPLHNEYIIHRLSLVPIRQSITNIDNLEFYIAKQNTKDIPIENEQSNILEVTTDNIQVYDKSTEKFLDPRLIFDGIFLITKLNLRQKILGSFTLSKGMAKEHSRWQCVNTIAYRYKVKADSKSGQEYDKITLEEERDYPVRVGTDEPQAFIFYLESLGKMETKLIIQKALEILMIKCQTFVDYINSNKKDLIWHKSSMLELEYEGEMHTLGNLISTIGLEMLGQEDFIGYRIVHPMLNKFVLRMKLADNDNKDNHIDKLLQISNGIISLVQKLMNEWKAF